MTSYWHSIVTMALSRIVSEIFNVEKCWDLEIRVRGHSRSMKVVSFNRLSYDFLLVFYCNFVPKMNCFWDIRLRKMSWPWNPGQRSSEPTSATCDFLLTFHSNHRLMSHHFRNRLRFHHFSRKLLKNRPLRPGNKTKIVIGVNAQQSQRNVPASACDYLQKQQTVHGMTWQINL